jgi:hypothetical protein
MIEFVFSAYLGKRCRTTTFHLMPQLSNRLIAGFRLTPKDSSLAIG